MLDTVDIFFTFIYVVECAIKVIAMGFAHHRNAYLRNTWNLLDFFIVLTGIVGLIPVANSSIIRAFRSMRVLRPLRLFNKLERMRQLVETFIHSIPGLFNVCIF